MNSDNRRVALPEPFRLKPYYDPLRVADVCDALDGIGYMNIGLVAPEIRALSRGTRFWGVAFTVRCVPANRPMWKLGTTIGLHAALRPAYVTRRVWSH